MTQGLQLIRTAFAGYEDSYVIIGGTACDIIMTDNDLDFRATKDIDMVLIAEGHLASLHNDCGLSFAMADTPLSRRTPHSLTCTVSCTPVRTGIPL